MTPYLLIGLACYMLQPGQPRSVIATVLLCAAAHLLTKGPS